MNMTTRAPKIVGNVERIRLRMYRQMFMATIMVFEKLWK
jgi:hypothetical protein